MARQVINLGLSTERDKTIIGFTRDNYSPECIKLLGPHLFELSKAEILTKEKEQIIRWFHLLEPSKKEEKELMMVHYLLQGQRYGASSLMSLGRLLREWVKIVVSERVY